MNPLLPDEYEERFLQRIRVKAILVQLQAIDRNPNWAFHFVAVMVQSEALLACKLWVSP